MWIAALALIMVEQPQSAPAAHPAHAPVTVSNSRRVPLADRIGTCEADGRFYDLHRLMLLENDSVVVDGPQGPLRVSIGEEFVQIDTAGPGPIRAIYATNIGDAAEPNAGLDVELKLGYFEGTLVVFWKETFRYRIYRQGLFRVTGESVAPLCVGAGGVTVRD